MADVSMKKEAFEPTSDESPVGGETTGTVEREMKPNKSWATRNGLNFASFGPHEDHATGTVELERTMKPRHLNMIAIGGRYVPIPACET